MQAIKPNTIYVNTQLVPPTEVISNAKTNRDAISLLRSKGYNVNYVRNNGTGEGSPPPTDFMSRVGFNKINDMTISMVSKDGQPFLIRVDKKFNGVVQDYNKIASKKTSGKNVMEFLDDAYKKRDIDKETYNQAKNCAKKEDWTGLYNILDKNNLLGNFLNWMKQELQKMAETLGKMDMSESMATDIQNRIIDIKQNKDEDDLQKRVETLLEKYGGKND